MIRRRHLHLLIALLLPLMVVRGLLPAGYMPVAQGGELRMALCGDGLQQPSRHDDAGDRTRPGSGADCLFAHAAAPAPPPTPIAIRAIEFVDAGSGGVHSAQQAAAVIPRAQSSRGPPVLQ